MKDEKILKAYEIAKEQYAALGVDTDEAIRRTAAWLKAVRGGSG